jgi:hypothetical protein
MRINRKRQTDWILDPPFAIDNWFHSFFGSAQKAKVGSSHASSQR